MIMNFAKIYYVLGLSLVLVVESCKHEPEDNGDLSAYPYNPTPYTITQPAHFPPMLIPSDNPMTEQGISLGQHLFYDPILSADSTQACASCHLPQFGFTDGKAFSKGIDGIEGTRSSMSLINIGYVKSGLFWDGRSKTLEEQALLPVEDPIEMHNTWPKAMDDLRKHKDYPRMFREAFGISNKSEMSKEMAAKAIAQFERIITSTNAKYDQVQAGLAKFTDLELYGQGLYFDDDPDLPDSECWHCHNLPLGSSDDFFNNGLTLTDELSNFPDPGRGKVTSSIADNGKFRAPSLRNIKDSAPYMHDGRLSTLDDVFAHYISGGKSSPNADPLIHKLPFGPNEIKALKAFINTLQDDTVYDNPRLKNPFK
jgi:cytochrome c peroxidase